MRRRRNNATSIHAPIMRCAHRPCPDATRVLPGGAQAHAGWRSSTCPRAMHKPSSPRNFFRSALRAAPSEGVGRVRWHAAQNVNTKCQRDHARLDTVREVCRRGRSRPGAIPARMKGAVERRDARTQMLFVSHHLCCRRVISKCRRGCRLLRWPHRRLDIHPKPTRNPLRIMVRGHRMARVRGGSMAIFGPSHLKVMNNGKKGPLPHLPGGQ